MSTVTSPHLFGLNGGEKKKQQILKPFSLFSPPLLGNCLCEFPLKLLCFNSRPQTSVQTWSSQLFKTFYSQTENDQKQFNLNPSFFQIEIVRNDYAEDIRGRADSGRLRGNLWLLSIVRCFMRISTSSQSRAREERDVSGQHLLLAKTFILLFIIFHTDLPPGYY